MDWTDVILINHKLLKKPKNKVALSSCLSILVRLYVFAFENDAEKRSRFVSMADLPQNETIEIGPRNLKLSLSSSSGQLKRISNSKTGIDMPVQQSYLLYPSNEEDAADSQTSGAYIFRPTGSNPTVVSRSVGSSKNYKWTAVDEVHQQFSSWISQVRDYREDWPLTVTQPVAGNYYPAYAH